MYIESLLVETISLPADIGGNLSYIRAGAPSGQKVIFLHGTPGSRNAWDEYLLEVPADLEYISLDRPAFGDSDPRRVLSLARQGEITAAFLQPDAEGRLPILIGHSYGATLAAWMAAEYPDQIGAIFLLAGSMTNKLDRPYLVQRWGVHPPWRWLIPGGLRRANDEVVALDTELAGFEDEMHRIVAPVVVLQGRKDGLVSHKNVEVIRANMINAAAMDITILEEAGHFLPWEHVAEVKTLLQRAIAYSRQAPKR